MNVFAPHSHRSNLFTSDRRLILLQQAVRRDDSLAFFFQVWLVVNAELLTLEKMVMLPKNYYRRVATVCDNEVVLKYEQYAASATRQLNYFRSLRVLHAHPLVRLLERKLEQVHELLVAVLGDVFFLIFGLGQMRLSLEHVGYFSELLLHQLWQ